MLKGGTPLGTTSIGQPVCILQERVVYIHKTLESNSNILMKKSTPLNVIPFFLNAYLLNCRS